MNPLETIIRDLIAAQGPLSLASYMELALQHPDYGYYRVREPLGRTGDFITAPEVSQMFGEMIGVWCVQAWHQMGKPHPFALVELGPGRGTMMRDLLRATAHVTGFHQAMNLMLLDSDRALGPVQSQNLDGFDPVYLDDMAALPTMPSLIVANEFFDALPVRQFIKTFRGWAEHKVVVEQDALALAPVLLHAAELYLISDDHREALPNTVVEVSLKAQTIMQILAAHLVAHCGAMLVIDYGYIAPSGAATVQAVSHHQHADIFDRPGEVDLTAHVDFTALARVARQAGSQVSPVIGQGVFLQNMGIELRADALKKKATLPQAAAIDAEQHRLIDADQMGTLFKVIEIRN